jgi:hypothetical protein
MMALMRPVEIPSRMGGGGPARQPSVRPLSVTILSVLGLLWVGMNVMIALNSFSQKQTNPAIIRLHAEYDKSEFHRAWMIAFPVISLAILIPLAWGAVRSMMMKEDGRKAMIIWAWISIASTILLVVFSHFWYEPNVILPAIARYNAISPPEEQMPIGSKLGMLFWVLAVIHPACVLYFFKTKRVIDAFAGGGKK